jgi:hypothetical protein
VLSVSQLNVSSINLPAFEASNWSLYPAISDVNISNYNINNVNSLSSSRISTNFIYSKQSEITELNTSSFQFTTAIGRDIGLSSIIANSAVFIPNAEDSDGIIAFANREVDAIYGVITTSENRSSFSVGAANNLTLVGASSIQMLGSDGIDMRTNTNRIIQMTTTALSIDASGVVINAEEFNTNALVSTNAITTDSIRANTYYNLPSSFVNEWSLYKAISTVTAEKDILNQPQYNIQDFLNINGALINAKTYVNPLFPLIPLGGTVNADISVNAPIGNFGSVVNTPYILTDKIELGTVTGTGEINLYGANLLAGDNSLYVEGGTTLSGGGLIHGVSIGAQTVGGINLQRIDVLPIGIDIVSDTFITIDSAATANIATGGALSLAAGSYIEYNTDQNYFINTSAGNDFTDIYVGNIHGADQGTDQLRINEPRGVKLDNVTEINLQQNVYNQYNSNTFYNQNDIVEYQLNKYVSLLENRYINPTSTISVFNSTLGYDIGNYVLSTPTVAWNCISTINVPYTRSTPSIFLSNVWTPYDGISTVNQIWGSYTSPGVSKIIGDNDSYLNIGKISTLITSTNELYSQIITTNVVYTTILGHPNSLVPTSIVVNNGMDFLQNNISNVNTFTSSNISTNYITINTLPTGDSGIVFINSNYDAKGIIQAQDNTLLIVGIENVDIASISSITIQADSNLTFGASNDTFVVGVSSLSLITPSTIRITADRGDFNIPRGITTQSISTNNISSGTFFTGAISSLTFNTSTLTTNTINGVNNILRLNGFVSSQSIRTSTIVSSNIFTSSILATAINTNTGTAGVFNSAFDYVSSATIRTNTLIGSGAGNGITTFSLQPINNTQSLNTNLNVPWSNAAITNFIGSNISTVSTTTNILNASSIRTRFLETTGVRSGNFNYLSTYTLKTDLIQGNAGSGGNIVIGGRLNPSGNNNTDMGEQTSKWNNLFINNVSTLRMTVSTINFKPYTYTSTLNIFPTGVSTYSITGTSAVVPQVLISNVSFPHLGNYLVTSKMTLTKASGGSGQEGYPCLCLSRGLYPSTFSTDDGFNALPYINHLNLSTFNTYTTSVSVTNTNQLTRFLTYYDQSGHNYTANMALADFRIRYIPSMGNNPDLGIS